MPIPMHVDLHGPFIHALQSAGLLCSYSHRATDSLPRAGPSMQRSKVLSSCLNPGSAENPEK